MATMDAVVLDEWGGDLSIETVPVPEPGSGDVRVDVRACGVTRTVENAIRGDLSDDPGLTPRVPGHEFAGVVEAVGDGVSDVAAGDRIVAYFYLICGRCDACRRGDTARCLDFDGWLGVQTDGAYAEKAVIPATNALPLAEDAAFAEGAVAADGLATPLHVCDRADVTDEDTVLIVGAAGRVGIHLAQVARERGAQVLAADVDGDRLARVDALTDVHVRPVDAREDFADRLREESGWNHGPTVVVDTVGDMEALREAWDAMAMGGRVVSLTTHHDRVFEAPMKEYVQKEASFLGTRHATKDEVVRAGRLLADGRIDAVYDGPVALDEVPAVHERIREGRTSGLTVLEP